MPDGTAINCPILGCLIGGLRQADMRSLVKWEKNGDLLGLILGAGLGPWGCSMGSGKQQDSGS